MSDDTAEHISCSKLSFSLLSWLINHLSLYYSVLPLNELLFSSFRMCIRFVRSQRKFARTRQIFRPRLSVYLSARNNTRAAEHIIMIFHVRACNIFWNIPLLALIRQK
jgi:hypothetical protein